jgi:predicted DNA-binding helix-hairpin-helix protein
MREDKWKRLQLGAKFDKVVIPVYDSAGRGRKIPLLKILVSSYCQNNCKYCEYRCERRTFRGKFEPKKLASIAFNLARSGVIQGVFFSSSIERDPENSTRKVLDTAFALRKLGFKGYIHTRLMPGCSKDIIHLASEVSDRTGLNIETSPANFPDICPDKDIKYDIFKRLRWLSKLNSKLKAGIDTQIIVGLGEGDVELIGMTERLYSRLGLRRVYFSGFHPIPRTPLEKREACPKWREKRLYQASFLLRDYKWSSRDFNEILDENGFLPNTDPKFALIKSRPEAFPIDINTANEKEILMLPGVGPIIAKRIIKLREQKRIKNLKDLEAIGLGTKTLRLIGPLTGLAKKQYRLDDRKFEVIST